MGETRLAGRYQPLEVIGRGGEATVLKAVDTRHDRLVALKVRVAPAGGSVDDLLAETRKLLALPPHSGLAHARDDFFDGDRHVLVLDWVDGVNLARLLAEEDDRGLPVSSVLHWVAQTAEALTVLHQHDVIHGDVKPANLILNHTGRIVLVDLGSSSTPLTATSRGGTPGFRAPEVAAGAPAAVARDVYSLAATAFTLLTGTAPADAAPAWDAIEPDVAAQIESALRAGLAIDPARRPATPGELVERLRAGWADQTPTGVGTVLMTDVVDSLKLWEQSPQRVPALLADMQLAVDRSVEAQGGRLLGATIEGDATISVFINALSALQAAIALQRSMNARYGVLRVRAGLATGELVVAEGDVIGPTVSRAARVRDFARPGEILLSASTADVVRLALPAGVELIALGPHALRGLDGNDEIAAVIAQGVSAPPDPARSPYPGLAPFAGDDADLFFGREEIVGRCIELFDRERFVAVVGASGSGKSSVVLAGIAPRLTEVIVVRPGTAPTRSLDEAGIPGHESAVLIVDQLEELVTICDDPAERAAFVGTVLSHPGGLVVTLRADLYGEFGAFPDLADRLASSQVLLGPLAAVDLVRAVQEPARRCGLDVEPGLTDIIAAELGDAPGALPLLGHALREAWLRREGRTITLAGYRASGGVDSAIAATAERALAELDREDQVIARRVLLRLVELRPDGEAGDPTRQRLLRTDLATDTATSRVLDTLVSSRLLIADQTTVELAHEAVCRAWPRLHAWLDEDRQWVRQLQHLATAARSWDSSGRPDGELYRGPRLEAAIESLQGHRDELTSTEIAFIEAGRAARDVDRDRDRRSTRRLRRLLAVAAAALGLAVAAGTVAVAQRRTAEERRDTADEQRRSSEVTRIGAQARDLVDDRLDLATLLAVEAHRHGGGTDALDALAGVLRAQPAIERFTSLGEGAVDAIDVGADGRRGAVLDDDALVRFSLPDLSTERAVSVPGATGVAVSPDSAKIAVTTPEGVTIVDAGTGEVDASLTARDVLGHGPREVLWVGPTSLGVRSALDLNILNVSAGDTAGELVEYFWVGRGAAIAVDAEGRRIAIGEEPAGLIDFATDSTVRVRDVSTGELIRSIEVPSARVSDLSFQPGGELLAVGTEDAGLYVLDTTNGETVSSRPSLVGAAGRFSPDGTELAVRDQAGAVAVIDPTTGDVLLPAVVHTGELRDVFFSPDGDALLVDAVTSVISVRIDGREPLATAPFGEPGEIPGAVRSDGEVVWAFRSALELSAEGNLDESESTAYRPADGTVVGTIRDMAYLYGPDDSWLYVGQDTGEALVADPMSGTTRYTSDWTWDRLVLSGTDAGMRIDVTVSFDGQVISVRRLPELTPAPNNLGPFDWDMLNYAISGDAQRLAFAILDDDGKVTLRVFDIASGDEVIEPIVWPDDQALPRSVAFTVDDSGLAIGDRAGRISQVDLTSGAVSPDHFPSLHGAVVYLQFAADGRLLAISQDGTIWMFDGVSRQPLGPPIVWATRPDGYSYQGGYLPSWDIAAKHLVVTDPQGLRSWNIDPTTWPAIACERAGRNLSRDEWARYMPADESYRPTCSQFPSG
jgi:class 3 adenylate cyclase/WD40 repeat protein/tRNA A-37 threonylcarbamoyl transferase component Bud32